MFFKNSPIYTYINQIIDIDFELFEEAALDETDIATANDPHLHKVWEIKIINPSIDNPKFFIYFAKPGMIHASTACDLSIEVSHQKISLGQRYSDLFSSRLLDEELIAMNIIPETFQSICKLSNLPQTEAIRHKLMSCILDNLLFLMDKVYNKQDAKKNSPFNVALDYMQSRYYQPNLGVEEIAKLVGVSPQYLNHVFRQKTGKTTKQNLVQIRLEHARELLESKNYLVKDVASLTGWYSPFYFCNCFKKQFGISPSCI